MKKQTCFGAVLKGHICLHVPSSFLLTHCQLYPNICSSPGNGAWPHFSRMHCNPWFWLVGARLNTPREAPFAQTLSVSVVQDRCCPQPSHGVRPCTSLTRARLLKGGERMSHVPRYLQGWGSRRSGVFRNLVWWTSGEKDLEVKLLRLIRPLGSGGCWGEEGWGTFGYFLSHLQPLQCNNINDQTI